VFIAVCAFTGQLWAYRCCQELRRIRARLERASGEDFARIERKTDALLGAAGLLGKDWPRRPSRPEGSTPSEGIRSDVPDS
jgi:hypothetical protein